MNPIKTAGIVLIVAGALGLAYGGFTYTRSSHETQLGPFSMTVKDRQTVAIPIWAGLGAVLVGGVLLLIPAKKG
jgi:multidrug transporter EmrE-like cation transporter